MGVRREGREAAVQYLYLCDLNGECELQSYYKFRGLSPSARKFCDALVQGARENQTAIDEAIRKSTQNYELNRISAVDRNILRIAVFEMLFSPETPPVVSINEGIEIAKKYSTEESGRFVNGVLDKVRSTLPRPARTPRNTAASEHPIASENPIASEHPTSAEHPNSPGPAGQ